MSMRNGGCEVVRKISEEAGLSVSGVYKTLNGGAAFSSQKRELIYKLACKYGYFSSGRKRSGGDCALKIGVLIPKYPLYFWDKAAAGMKAAAEAAEGVGLRFYYYPCAYNNEDVARLMELLLTSSCNGYIVYPVHAVDWKRLTLSLCAQGRLIFFNDMQEDIEFGPFAAYVGPEHFEEGAMCAYLAARKIAEMKRICVLTSEANLEKFMLGRRVQGFINSALAVNPEAEIKKMALNLDNNLAAAQLAGRIKSCYHAQPLDCIYVSSGFLYLACMAAEKLNRTESSPCINTICLGHEHSVADKRYSQGRIYAYVAQDAYMQGYYAVKELASAFLEDRGVKSMYFNSTPVQVMDIKGQAEL